MLLALSQALSLAWVLLRPVAWRATRVVAGSALARNCLGKGSLATDDSAGIDGSGDDGGLVPSFAAVWGVTVL